MTYVSISVIESASVFFVHNVHVNYFFYWQRKLGFLFSVGNAIFFSPYSPIDLVFFSCYYSIYFFSLQSFYETITVNKTNTHFNLSFLSKICMYSWIRNIFMCIGNIISNLSFMWFSLIWSLINHILNSPTRKPSIDCKKDYWIIKIIYSMKKSVNNKVNLIVMLILYKKRQ